MSAEDAVRRSLRRIAERDAVVRAWTHVDAAGALREAIWLDALPAARHGPLHGMPVGVKDVIDVAGMPTLHNSPLGDPRPVLADAPCVAMLRAAGAIILGKTDTTEFAAAGRNAATANPHAPDRTPGGSSSGSAAAVADGHVPLALGTQTGGSTIRPASFCGVHALKPTWGAVPREGAKVYANSFDTIGLYASSLDNLDRLAAVYDLGAVPIPPDLPLRIGVCRTPWWSRAEAETQKAMDSAASTLAVQGSDVVELHLPPLFERMEDAFRVILFREGGVAFSNLARVQPDLLHADFHERVASKGLYSDAMLRDAYDEVSRARCAIETAMAPFDVLLTLSAPGIAPLGRAPGNPIFNQMWTMLHIPVLHLPLFRAENGMPLGLSLVAPRFEDRKLLFFGRRIQAFFEVGY